jgi:hypothetical protein
MLCGTIILFGLMSTMKNLVAISIGIAASIGVTGCSSSNPKLANHQPSDTSTAATIEDARVLYESGDMDSAEQELRGVLTFEPNNLKAKYY